MTQENNTKQSSFEFEKTNNDIQNIQVPFPVKLNFNEIYYNHFTERFRRPKNAYYIFRRELIREFKKNNISFKTTKIIGLVSKKWINSPIEIKNDYRNCSRDIEDFKAYINKPPIYQIVKF
ncbi:hypothetical protein C1645_823892 [Glomus cerebriforme]|uniref:HMG box domain-containing protein n=1 Tax=Glomus cerebriforme TaxID=658196 RepID=A0A397SZH3_9GLOM|nr:hypothetical protein C1645_823892 [Glomus cerebriforme]